MKVKQIGIDIGKNASHLIALGVDGGIAWRKQFSRSWLLSFLESTVGECPSGYFRSLFGRALAGPSTARDGLCRPIAHTLECPAWPIPRSILVVACRRTSHPKKGHDVSHIRARRNPKTANKNQRTKRPCLAPAAPRLDEARASQRIATEP
jgi:hypothetical protein